MNSLIERLQQGATIITPNNRLSQQLLQRLLKQNQGRVLPKPQCFSYSLFLNQIFTSVRQLHAKTKHPILLSSLQQHTLWQKLINRQLEQTCNTGLLTEIMESWKNCQLWEIDVKQTAFSLTPQTRMYQSLHTQFESELKRLGAITEHQIVPYVVKLMDPADKPRDVSLEMNYQQTLLCNEIIWVCFDELTPQQRTLRETLESHGCLQDDFEHAAHDNPCFQLAAKDNEEELNRMVDWLLLRLSEGDEQIAVVVPDLETQSQHLKRLLEQRISKEYLNLSLGAPLLDYPLVSHALHWLQLDRNQITHQSMRLLLHSPYLKGAESEAMARAQFMQDTPLLQERTVPFSLFLTELRKYCPKLVASLEKLTPYPQQASPMQWIQAFKSRLVSLGFPGELPLNSASYQCLQRLTSLLDELMTLSVFTVGAKKRAEQLLFNQELTATEALETLQSWAQQVIFQPKTASTRIQILGLLEASGCSFDSVWVSGLTDHCLPQKTRLSAFIPISVQRTYKMPHAVVERELPLAQKILSRIRYGSKLCVLSYPAFIADIPQLPSPLLSGIDAYISSSCISPSSALSGTFSQEWEKESLIEDYCLPLLSGEIASGGTALLSYQAQCPFRAFAAHRLHAKTGLDLSDGPNAAERGQVLHRVMEILWKQLGSQKALLDSKPAELNQLIHAAIESAIQAIITLRPHSFPPVLQNLERERLTQLVHACFAWEITRPNFVIHALEATHTLELAGMVFKIRLDRLDQLEDGSKWIIDYKTTLPTSNPWHEERPEASQLLLYALLDSSINALLFLQLKNNQIFIRGLSEEAWSMPGLVPLKEEERWSTYQNQWRERLTVLAEEFQTGQCAPAPTQKSTCNRCEFQSLCRVELTA